MRQRRLRPKFPRVGPHRHSHRCRRSGFPAHHLAFSVALLPPRPIRRQTPLTRTPTSHMLKHSPTKAQPCSEWSWTTTWQPWKPTSAAFLGSSQCVSGTATTARRRQAFEIHLVDLLWPQPPLTRSSHQGSTLGPLIPVVAACVKDARPSRWLAPLERPRWPQHRPLLKQSAGASFGPRRWAWSISADGRAAGPRAGPALGLPRRAQALLETPKAKHWQKLRSWPLFPGTDIWVSISDPQELTEVAKTGSNRTYLTNRVSVLTLFLSGSIFGQKPG